MNPLHVLLILIAGWLATVITGWIIVTTVLRRGPGDDPVSTILWAFVWLYTRIMHRPTFIHRVPWPKRKDIPHGLIIVSNHTGAVDPLLIQSDSTLHIRWMMGRDMMFGALNVLWKHQKMIPVDRTAADSGALRTAIRLVRDGGVLGIFPEGRIVSPTGEIRPFAAGVGMIIAKSRAPVLVCWITDTPPSVTMMQNLTTRSHARLEVLELVDFGEERDPHAITDRLRRIIADASGWTLNDEPLPSLADSDQTGWGESNA
jgi:1-acyl-sn-glycerol-3-phosphate acyltransferase